MKKSKFTESQIIRALKENEGGRSVEQISRELGINKGTVDLLKNKTVQKSKKSINFEHYEKE